MNIQKAKILDAILLKFVGNRTFTWTQLQNGAFGDIGNYHLIENNINFLIGEGHLRRNEIEPQSLTLTDKGFATMTDLPNLGYVVSAKKERRKNAFKALSGIILVASFGILIYDTWFHAENYPPKPELVTQLSIQQENSLNIKATSTDRTRGNYLIVLEDTTQTQKFGYVFINKNGDTVTRLDTAKYFICFSDTIQNFAIVGIRNKVGWWAIDKNEKILFKVFNTSSGEPSPDELRQGMIRIVDDSGKIGFANYEGEILITPQFEAASTFHNGKAIIGKQCEQILWCCKGENEDKHYITECKQTGYINQKGEVQSISSKTFEQIQDEIGWKSEDE
jgi:hypothetical protein